DAILHRKPLIAPAAEGIRSVELANAMLLSSFTDKTISLPIDARAFDRLLNEKIAASKPKKNDARRPADPFDDFSKSFKP
ncbi:MAG TPA: hypothetical protein VIT00_13915, partial [Terrimicrobiaceae bacterium]